MPTAEPVSSHQASLGEGPHWIDEKLYWLDIVGKRLLIHDPAGQDREMPLPCMPGAIAPRRAGGLIVAWEQGFSLLDPKTLVHEPICHPESGVTTTRFNDGGIDPAGRFWAGTMGYNGEPNFGSLYMLGTDRRAYRKVKPVSVSNGIAWSRDGQTMYYVDSLTRLVQAFDFDVTTGEISHPRIAIRIDHGAALPDGMTMDLDGNLWIALWDGGAVICHDPVSGKLIDRIDLPVRLATSCAFGGSDFKTLYITTAYVSLTDAQRKEQPLAGRVFAADVGVRGGSPRLCDI